MEFWEKSRYVEEIACCRSDRCRTYFFKLLIVSINWLHLFLIVSDVFSLRLL